MKKITIHQADSFTTNLFGGNPAGVVTDADSLTDKEMQSIAREMNLSETAFVLTPTTKEATVRLRYFTSGKAEVKFCGHATVAALYEIAKNNLLGTEKVGEYHFVIETKAGLLTMDIIKKSMDDIFVRFTAPPVDLTEYSSQHKDFSKRFDIALETIDTDYPVMIDKNLNYIYLTIRSLKNLGNLQFNFQQIVDNFKDEGIVVFCLLTPETFDKRNNVHARGLAPLVGIPEDPFTGSMQAGLAKYIKENKILPNIGKVIKTEQGHFMDRPGYAETSEDGNDYVITGQAVHVFSSELSL